MGLVRFCGKQFVLAPVILALLWLLLSAQAAPVLSAAGPWPTAACSGSRRSASSPSPPCWPGQPGSAPSRVDHAWGLTGTLLAAAMFVLAVVDSLAATAGWHSPAMDILTMGWRICAGLPELAAFAVTLGPLVAGTLLLQLTAALTRDATPERPPGRAWVWAVAGLLVAAGGVLTAVLAR